MKLYKLLWILLAHGLRGRFRDEVHASVLLDNEVRTIGLVGAITGLDPVGKGEGFCILDAACEDRGPWTDSQEFTEVRRSS